MKIEHDHCDLCWPGIFQAADDRAQQIVRQEHPEWFGEEPRSWNDRWVRDQNRSGAIAKARHEELARMPPPAVVLIEADEDRYLHLCAEHLLEAAGLLGCGPNPAKTL